MHTYISLGSTLIGAFMGRKVSRYSTNNASRVMRGMTRATKEKKDIERAIQTRELYEQQLVDVENEFKAEIAELDYKIKNNIEIRNNNYQTDKKIFQVN
jgi:hypothetical protein